MRFLWWLFVILALLAVGWYFYFYRGIFRAGLNHPFPIPLAKPGEPAKIVWQNVDRRDAAFHVEMPAGPRELQVPAYNEKGSSEPVEMIVSNPDSATSFAVSWEDNPPVARVNDRVPDRTLEQARDGMLAATHTSLITQSRPNVEGFPALDLTAKNSQGGILDARLIFMHDRLYTMIAAYPSMDARHEQDVIRFYNSFTPLRLTVTTAEGGGNS